MRWKWISSSSSSTVMLCIHVIIPLVLRVFCNGGASPFSSCPFASEMGDYVFRSLPNASLSFWCIFSTFSSCCFFFFFFFFGWPTSSLLLLLLNHGEGVDRLRATLTDTYLIPAEASGRQSVRIRANENQCRRHNGVDRFNAYIITFINYYTRNIF